MDPHSAHQCASIDPYATMFAPEFAVFHLVALFVLGACFGSFFNVCIYRIPMGVSLSHPPSHCYGCGRPIRWFDNIPILSWWCLRGRCRACGIRISPRYFIIETLTALLWVAVAWRIQYSWALIPALALTSLLIVATFTDLDHYIIPLRVSLGGLALGVALAAIAPLGRAEGNPLRATAWMGLDAALWWAPLVHSLLGAAVGFASLWTIGRIGSILFRKEAMGMGDVHLFGMFGAFCGVAPLLYILLIACIVGSILGLAGIAWDKVRRPPPIHEALAPLEADAQRAERLLEGDAATADERLALTRALTHPGPVGPVRHYLPFGPSLAAAAWVVYLYGDAIERWIEAWMLGSSGWVV